MNPGAERHQPADSLERDLAAASQWQGGDTALWDAALNSHTGRRTFGRSILPRFAAIAAVVAIGILLVGLMLPSLGKVRSSARVADHAKQSVADASYLPSPAQPRMELRSDGISVKQELSRHEGAPSSLAIDYYAPSVQRQESPDARQVIRKAQMTLAVPDVRAAFFKTGLIVSEAQGEYVQESALTGADAHHSSQTGSLTLRVAASRLSTVLNQLRELGVVVSETSGGEDVTEQMVDIEARLRNEQRIESELIALLDTRKASPLAEVLQVRQSLSDVRERIERMNAQRERLSRLVSLATVLVLIRHQEAGQVAAAMPAPTLLDHLASAWNDGVKSLVRSIAWLVEVIVGGLLIWTLAACVVVIALVWRRRALRRAAEEPAPRTA